MVGRILLMILAVLLILLLIALLIPVYVRITYADGKTSFSLRYAFITRAISSGGDGSEEKKKTVGETDEKKSPKSKAKVNAEQIRYSLDILPGILSRMLKRVGRGIRVEPLKVYVLVASKDPADTAVLFGKIEGALAALLPALHKKLRIKEQDIRVYPDFCGESMDLIADVGIGLRPITVFRAVLCAAGSLIVWFIRVRKLADKTVENKPSDNDTAAQTETAA